VQKVSRNDLFFSFGMKSWKLICGRNRTLHEQLTSLGEPSSRLRVIGWTADMPPG
jgi:hypothetical protein